MLKANITYDEVVPNPSWPELADFHTNYDTAKYRFFKYLTDAERMKIFIDLGTIESDAKEEMNTTFQRILVGRAIENGCGQEISDMINKTLHERAIRRRTKMSKKKKDKKAKKKSSSKIFMINRPLLCTEDGRTPTTWTDVITRIIDDIFEEPGHLYTAYGSVITTRAYLTELPVSSEDNTTNFHINVNHNWADPVDPRVVVVAEKSDEGACTTTTTTITFLANAYNDATAARIRNLVKQSYPDLLKEIVDETKSPNTPPEKKDVVRFKFFKYLTGKQRLDILTMFGAIEENAAAPMAMGTERKWFDWLVGKGKLDELEIVISDAINAQKESDRFDTIADDIDKISDDKSVRESISDIVEKHDILTCEKLDKKLRNSSK